MTGSRHDFIVADFSRRSHARTSPDQSNSCSWLPSVLGRLFGSVATATLIRPPLLSLCQMAHQLVCIPRPTHVCAELQLDFARNAVALSAEAQDRLAALVNLVRSWCGFEFAYATGHADATEGESSNPRFTYQRLVLNTCRGYAASWASRKAVSFARAYGHDIPIFEPDHHL